MRKLEAMIKMLSSISKKEYRRYFDAIVSNIHESTTNIILYNLMIFEKCITMKTVSRVQKNI